MTSNRRAEKRSAFRHFGNCRNAQTWVERIGGEGGRRFEAGQEFTCAGHPEAVFCAPRLTAEEDAPLRCSKTTSGRRQAAPLARRSEFLPSLFAFPPYGGA
jgi:hypothetical protein